MSRRKRTKNDFFIGERLKAWRKELGLTQKDLAEVIEVAPNYVSYVEKGEKALTSRTLNHLRVKLNADLNYLLTGQHPDSAPKTIDSSFSEPDNAVSKNQNMDDSMRNLNRVEGGPVPIEQGRPGRREGYVYVPKYDVTAVGGEGEFIYDEGRLGLLAFRIDFVRQELGVPVNKLVVISASGNSMEPFIYPGDTLIINMADQHLASDSVYVINYDGGLLVKRVEVRLDSKMILLKSDNEKYTPQEIKPDQIDQLNVVGKVAWVMKKA